MNKEKIRNKIKEAQEQIKDLQKTVNNLEEQLNKTEGRWKPGWTENYYYIQPNGGTTFTNNLSDIDQGIIAIDNCFKTKEEALFEVEKLKVLAELKEFAFEPDWTDPTQKKWSFEFEHGLGNIDYFYCLTLHIPNVIYFSTEEKCKDAVKKVGEGRIKRYIFGVEE